MSEESNSVSDWLKSLPQAQRPSSNTSCEELVDRIRKLVSEEGLSKELHQDEVPGDQLCAALDVIEDSFRAIDSYLDGGNVSLGLLYLETYGVLQAFFVCREGVRILARIAGDGLQIEPGDAWKELLRVRNLAAGHPTSAKKISGHIGETLVGFITQSSLRRGSFDLYWVTNGAPTTDHVDLTDLLRQHREETRDHLIHVLAEVWRYAQSIKSQ